jgi:hypothetical protein
MGTLSDTTGGTLKEANATWTVAASNTGTVTNLSGTFAGMANLRILARCVGFERCDLHDHGLGTRAR